MRTRPIQNSTVRATRPFYQKERASVQKPQEQDEFIPTRAKEPHVLQPESGRSYRVNKENSRAITLSFDKRAVAFFQNSDVQIDLEQAALLTSDGRRLPLDARVSENSGPAQDMAVAQGEKLSFDSEPWQFRVPGMPTGVFGKPYGVHVYGGNGGIGMKFLDRNGLPIDRESEANGLDDSQGMRVDVQVFRANRRATLGRLAVARPGEVTAGPACLPYTDTTIPNVRFRAPDQDSLKVVTSTFDKLLGGVAKERAERVDLDQLKRFEKEFQKRLTLEMQGGAEVDGFSTMIKTLDDPNAREAMEKIYGAGAGSLSNEELFSGVGQKLLKASPLEIIVIPRDKTALDCVEVKRESTKQQLSRAGRAYFLRSNPFAYRAESRADDLPAQRLFIGQEILQSEQGIKAVLLHEMLHVFEHLYANPEESRQIEESFQQATEFQSLYGSSRDEYITTVGEEFFATHGADGPSWSKEHHRPVYDLLSQLTGTDPAA